MTTQTQLFPTDDLPCTKQRRVSTDRNGRYVFECSYQAGHSGTCLHRWHVDTIESPAA